MFCPTVYFSLVLYFPGISESDIILSLGHITNACRALAGIASAPSRCIAIGWNPLRRGGEPPLHLGGHWSNAADDSQERGSFGGVCITETAMPRERMAGPASLESAKHAYMQNLKSIAKIPRKRFPKIEALLDLFASTREKGLLYWRERILLTILMVGVGPGLIVYFVSIPVALREGHWHLVAINTAGYLLGLCALLARKTGYEVRAAAALLVCYAIGTGVTATMSIFSGGPAWLFGFAILAGLLMGTKAAILALAANAVTLGLLGYLMSQGALIPGQYLPISPTRAMVAGANFILVNTVVALSVSVLVRGLQNAAEREKAAVLSLQDERRQLLEAKEELKRSEEKYRILAENINDVLWTMDLDLNLMYISPAIEKMQGWKGEEAARMRIDELVTADSLGLIRRILSEEFEAGEATGDFQRSVRFEAEMQCRNGSTIVAEITASFLLGDDGRPVGILGVNRDITERIEAQKEKEVLQEKLTRSRKMEALGLLAGGVAHDLNNVLSGIVSYPDLILMDLPEDSALRAPILTMKDSGQKAATIVQDLLTLARRGVTTKEVLNLNEIVEGYLGSPEYRRLQKYHPQIEVETTFETELPNIRGSSVHLRKTVMNLVSNAAEAQPAGGKILISTASCYLEKPIRGYEQVEQGEYVVLRVEDSGEGIAAEDLTRIFEPFYTKKVMGRSGTGLGMAVVWGTIQDHHGYIDVRSTEGRGTVFELFFPLTRETLPSREPPFSIEEHCGNGETILIVDDLADQREILSRMLAKLNYRVYAASSGEEAVEFLFDHAVDLVVLDMIMDPGIDGLETYRRIIELYPGQKAIIASGFSETQRVQQAQRLGAGPYVKKPYTIEKIGRAIQRLLRSTR